MARTWKATRHIALAGTSLAAAWLFVASPAHAQDTPGTTQDDASAGDTGSDDNEIIVTGSSIRGVPPTGSNLISVTIEDIKLVGATTARRTCLQRFRS